MNELFGKAKLLKFEGPLGLTPNSRKTEGNIWHLSTLNGHNSGFKHDMSTVLNTDFTLSATASAIPG